MSPFSLFPRSQRLFEVGDQIVGMLDADREADQLRRGHRALTLAGRAVLDQAFDASERRGTHEQLRPRNDRPRLVPASADAKREHPTEGAHLPRGDRMPGVAFEPRIVHDRDLGMPLQRACDGQCVLRMALHAQRERPEAPQYEPRGERAGDGAQDVARMLGPVEHSVAAGEHQRPAHHVAVAAEVLRGGLECDVGAQLERTLERRGREGVVDNDCGPCALRQRDGRREIHDSKERVRRRLQPHDPRGPQERVFEVGEIAHVHNLGHDPPLREEIARSDVESVISVVRQDQAVAGIQPLKDRNPRGHARGKNERRLSPIEARKRRFELSVRRTALAHVLVLAGQIELGVSRERRGEVDRRGHGPRRGVSLRHVHGDRLELHWRITREVPGGIGGPARPRLRAALPEG